METSKFKCLVCGSEFDTKPIGNCNVCGSSEGFEGQEKATEYDIFNIDERDTYDEKQETVHFKPNLTDNSHVSYHKSHTNPSIKDTISGLNVFYSRHLIGRSGLWYFLVSGSLSFILFYVISSYFGSSKYNYLIEKEIVITAFQCNHRTKPDFGNNIINTIQQKTTLKIIKVKKKKKDYGALLTISQRTVGFLAKRADQLMITTIDYWVS